MVASVNLTPATRKWRTAEIGHDNCHTASQTLQRSIVGVVRS
jgi:hypothetical protein